MIPKNVNETNEAGFVKSLKWALSGNTWRVEDVKNSDYEKLKAIFNNWEVGFNCDREDSKSNINVNISNTQCKRVSLKLGEVDGTNQSEQV